MKVLFLGAGGFWTLEAVYQQVNGVTEVIPGYMGGTVENPGHDVVATGMTGHAEVVKIIYDESIVSMEDLLRIFYKLHDPAAPIHSGRGIGSQYRPVIFFTEHNDGEASAEGNGSAIGGIENSMAEIQATLPAGVSLLTEMMTAQVFYPADESHYNYYREHADDSYCTTIIEPKIIEIKQQFPQHF
jgi:peptide-methionine (S)-S-oxide reductase